MKSSADVATAHTLAFLATVLPGDSLRIVEVGCGTGELARKLVDLGHQVLGIESDERAARLARALGVEVRLEGFLDSRLEPADVLLFTRSLHHIDPLGAALGHARDALRPGGLLVCEDFDVAAPDEATARWFYRQRQRCLPGEELPAPGLDDPMEAWGQEHDHHPGLHPGSEMLRQSSDHFSLERVDRGPYLYRYVSTRLPTGGSNRRVAERLLRDEERAIAAAEILPVGLRWVGLAG